MLTTQAVIIFWLALVVLSFFVALWQYVNTRGVKSRGRRRSDPNSKRERKSDTRTLTGTERRLYKEAKRLLGQGRVAPAARVFEQLNMHREAIQVLEEAGMIHEAAKILMRMQRHNRAGVIYARHDMWDNAAQCFKVAGMPAEVAKCARLAGNHEMAAEYFDKAGRHEEAAACFEILGAFSRAARLYALGGDSEREMAAWSRAVEGEENLAVVELEDDELNRIIDWVGGGHADRQLARLLASRQRLTDAIRRLVTKGLVSQAASLYPLAAADPGPTLMGEVNYQGRGGANLAELFQSVGAHHYAGMVFERLAEFERAAEAFERAQDYERAAYCFERAGLAARARRAKQLAGDAGGRAAAKPARGAGGGAFALSAVMTSMHDGASAPETNANFSEGNDEKTAFIKVKQSDDKNGKDGQGQVDESGSGADDVSDSAPQFGERDNGHSRRNQPPVLTPDRHAFHASRFFADLDFDQKEKLWNIGETLSFRSEQNLLTYNDEPRGIYVITKGSVNCYKQVGGREQYLDEMHESESFGELWLLADQPTAVRFVAAGPTTVRVIGRDAFNDLLDKDGTIARKLYKRFTMRLIKRLIRPSNNKVNQAAS